MTGPEVGMWRTGSTEVGCPAGVVEVNRLPPHRAGGFTSRSEPFGFGVSFTGHRAAEIRVGSGASHVRSFAAGTVGLTGPRSITWLDVAEPSESVDIRPAPALLVEVGARTGCRWADLEEYRQLPDDDVIWGTCVAFRTAVLRGAAVAPSAASALIANVAVHVAVTHLGGRRPRGHGGRLDPATLRRVGVHLRAHHRRVVTLDEMAAVALMSPYHFHRAFRRTAGVTPATYAMAVRMERAHRSLTAGTTVRATADEIGIADLSQFRRTYRRFFGDLAPAF
ncbi:helix-turn-helix transcriptional regulator [Mycobacterium manitobense]|uniref:Helix-turn-helix transcriptional regulator n=1 Tax=[Mycobacterium] manitobense TaxID=190147 RepID=A0A9X2YQI5_9MYCO|nr:helix-turn-helix transcriptional regulator [[Mycobacterium] manitobense]MCV7172535.1 helix-turn-helix transcriptional regulator [[Mycobacterium] manitobense]